MICGFGTGAIGFGFGTGRMPFGFGTYGMRVAFTTGIRLGSATSPLLLAADGVFAAPMGHAR